MACTESSDLRGRASAALHSFSRLSGSLSDALETGPSQLAAVYHREVRLAANALVLALLTAFFLSVAAGFAAVTVLIALWQSHAVLASALLATAFGLLGVTAVLLLRVRTRVERTPHY